MGNSVVVGNKSGKHIETECYFDLVPVEVTVQICSYLDSKSICNLSQANSGYYASINESPIWKYLYERDFGVQRKFGQQKGFLV